MLGIHFGQPFYLNIVSVDGDKKANNTMDSKTMVYIKSLNSPIMALVYIHSISLSFPKTFSTKMHCQRTSKASEPIIRFYNSHS